MTKARFTVTLMTPGIPRTFSRICEVASSRSLGGAKAGWAGGERVASGGCLATASTLVRGQVRDGLRATESTAMEAEKSSLVVRDLETPKKDIQMRVTPSEVKFLDAQAGRVYRLPVTVHNLGRNNQKIRFQEPVKPQVTHPGVFRAGPGA